MRKVDDEEDLFMRAGRRSESSLDECGRGCGCGAVVCWFGLGWVGLIAAAVEGHRKAEALYIDASAGLMQMLGCAAASNLPMRGGVVGAIPGRVDPVHYARITTT